MPLSFNQGIKHGPEVNYKNIKTCCSKDFLFEIA